MKIALSLLSLGLVLALTLAESNISPPVVKVYTAEPVEFGKKNELICYAYDYHPPRMEISLLKNGVEIPDTKQKDPSFHHNWKYYTMMSAHVHIDSDDKVECLVAHNGSPPKRHKLDMF
ncbi:hypothetical protein XENTR_v10023292 [Xenopus tropicalis]|uniref:Beta-2-microglobulin n=2 Tax=Xenopus tropicalis TaxID=8364 RepID=A0A6I8PKK9_XENTR